MSLCDYWRLLIAIYIFYFGPNLVLLVPSVMSFLLIILLQVVLLRQLSLLFQYYMLTFILWDNSVHFIIYFLQVTIMVSGSEEATLYFIAFQNSWFFCVRSVYLQLNFIVHSYTLNSYSSNLFSASSQIEFPTLIVLKSFFINILGLYCFLLAC